MKQRGFSLIELLLVVSIIALILLIVFANLKTQLQKARDSQRKSDLTKIQKSFEDYFNDAMCYPAAEVLDNCGSADLSPYLKSILCDPISRDPYVYVPGSPSLCSGYRVCAKLENKEDSDIARIGCHPEDGCGFGAGYNYCVSAGVPAAL